eukprot:299138-Pelagomonas_calceolata.AAC.5
MPSTSCQVSITAEIIIAKNEAHKIPPGGPCCCHIGLPQPAFAFGCTYYSVFISVLTTSACVLLCARYLCHSDPRKAG